MEGRILLVDDDELLTAAWARVLRAAQISVEIANSAEEAEKKLACATYAVVLVDLRLNDGESGAELVDILRRLPTRPAVAVVSGFLDSAKVAELCDGTDIFVPKPLKDGALIQVVQFLLAKSAGREPLGAFCREHGLSPREREVLTAAARGRQNKQIAVELGCEVSTVTTYWGRIFDKVGCRSRHEVLAALFRSHATTERLR